MEFYQKGKYLYLLGGYGYSATLGDHTTFSNLTAIDVPGTIDAVINNANLESYSRQITDPQFQVTGGRLEKINNTFYLVGGQKFLGRYNPMGPNHGPGFVQTYTDQIRKFNLIAELRNCGFANLLNCNNYSLKTDHWPLMATNSRIVF